MNPLGWHREQQVAFGVFIILGVLVGLWLGWHQTSLYPMSGSFFIMWVQMPDLYWPWPAWGASIAGLSFYGIHLVLQKSR